jgi:hypothetical protein
VERKKKKTLKFLGYLLRGHPCPTPWKKRNPRPKSRLCEVSQRWTLKAGFFFSIALRWVSQRLSLIPSFFSYQFGWLSMLKRMSYPTRQFNDEGLLKKVNIL